MKSIALAAASLAAAFCSSSAAAEGWGSVTGKFVLDGDIPETEVLVEKGDAAVKDAAVCAAEAVPDDSLIVDEETKTVANVVLFPNRFKGSIHPDAAERPDEVVFDQKNCRFFPHILLVQAGQTIRVKSDDDCAHNARCNLMRNTAFNAVIPPNEREGIEVSTSTAELLPLPVKCDIHPYMIAHWLILDSPYMAVSKPDGTFEIANLPEGEHKFKIWHERTGFLETRFKVEIKDGEVTDLGEIKVDASKIDS